jgi:hypothetical protein
MSAQARFSLLLLACASVAATVPAMASPTCANPVGEWTNQLKSTLNIKTVDSSTGAVAGTYISPSGTSGGEYPLVGWVNKLAPESGKDNAIIISFMVNWGSVIGTVTTWMGVCRMNGTSSTMAALWHLGSPVTKYEWSHVLAGQDIFSPK